MESANQVGLSVEDFCALYSVKRNLAYDEMNAGPCQSSALLCSCG